MTEIWVTTPIFSSDYAVSNLGRVRTKARNIVRSNGRPQSIRGRILRAAPDDCGYLQVSLHGHTVKVHRLVALAFLGERPGNEQIRHLDGNPQNNNVENLAYGSASENIQDMYRYRGAVRAGQKLTPAVAEDIRMGIASGAPNKTLAETYGVSQQTICDIKHKRIYAGGNV